jgi:hypothetical protein
MNKETCVHWQDIGHPSGGKCNHPDINKTVSFGVCSNCPLCTEPDWWLAFRRKHKPGTTIKNVTTALGIKPCGGCNKRAAYLDGEGTKQLTTAQPKA